MENNKWGYKPKGRQELDTKARWNGDNRWKENSGNLQWQKIEDLKNNIDPTQIKDLMEKIAEKVKTKKLNVSLETVTKKKVKCVIEEMKKKILNYVLDLNIPI